MGTFWKCLLVKFMLTKFVLTKDLVYHIWDMITKVFIWFQVGSDDQTLINMYIMISCKYTTIYLGLSMLHTLYIETPYITSVVQEGTY